MSKITRSITVEQKVWNQAMEKAGHGNLSNKIEELLQKYAEVEDNEVIKDIDILQKSNLSAGQKKSVRNMIRERKSEINIQQFRNFVMKKGIYDRKDFIKRAVKNISKDDKSLYKKEGDKLLIQQIECYCGSTVSPIGSQGNCPRCGRQLVDLKSESATFKVV